LRLRRSVFRCVGKRGEKGAVRSDWFFRFTETPVLPGWMGGARFCGMKMVLEIPDEISEELERKLANPARAALEALAAAAYAQGALSLEQVRRLLDLESMWDAKAVLSNHGAWPSMEVEDFREDLAVLQSLRRGA
jgi:predicted HTH domain antitoxin